MILNGYLRNSVCEFSAWIKLAQYRSHLRGSVNIMMNVVVS